MRLRTKTALFTLLSLAVVVIVLRVLAQLTVNEPFEILEANRAAEDILRVRTGFEVESDRLHRVAVDYGGWDTTYDFAASADSEFVQSNFSYESLSNLMIDFVLIRGANRELLYAAERPKQGTQLVNLAPSAIAVLSKPSPEIEMLEREKGGHGLIAMPNGWAAIASYPILNSQNEGPARGFIFFGRYVNSQFLAEMKSSSRVAVAIRTLDSTEPVPAGFEQWTPEDALPDIEVIPLDRSTVLARAPIYDLLGRQAFWLEITEPMKAYPQAIASVRAFMTVLVLAGLLVGAGILWLVRHSIVTRIENLDFVARRISPGNPEGTRFPKVGSDEIAALADTLNGMLDDLRRYERELRSSEERYALIARAANDGLWDWNLLTGAVYYSPRWAQMAGLDPNEIGETSDVWLARVHPEDRPLLEEIVRELTQGGTDSQSTEYRLRHADGTYRWMLCRSTVVRSEGRAIRLAGSQTDITDRKVAEEQLVHDAFHDKLTDLPNRALFADWLSRCMRRSQRNARYQFAVLFLDLDHFKNVNDSLGHLVGDELLRALGLRLRSCLREHDAVARLGGDEFAILVDDIADVSDATRVAQRVLEMTREPFLLVEKEVFIGASIGIAVNQAHYQGPQEILRDADTALYRAKASGRGHYAVFDKTMHEKAMSRLDLETDLRRAIDNGEFEVHYQPVVSLPDHHMVSMEALVRWRHPQRGLVSPGDFIPIAEETGLIGHIGEWVLRRACQDMAAWREKFPQAGVISVAVNVSTRQFRTGLVEAVAAVLKETNLPPRRLALEITESLLMEDAARATATLKALRELGVRISLDDFGTGYSSLNYLHRLDIDVLKIDRSFVNGIGDRGKHDGIIRSILLLAGSLGVPVIAEGVESLEQASQLAAIDCQFVQGYYFSKPVPAPGIEAIFAANTQLPLPKREAPVGVR